MSGILVALSIVAIAVLLSLWMTASVLLAILLGGVIDLRNDRERPAINSNTQNEEK